MAKGKMIEINKERNKKIIWKNDNVSSNSFLHLQYLKKQFTITTTRKDKETSSSSTITCLKKTRFRMID